MSIEKFHALALPHSVRPAGDDDAAVHVSVFLAPTLEPSQEVEPLERFAVFPDWASRVRDSVEVRLENQLGVIEGVRPLVEAVDPATWRELFPADRTPVRRNRVPDWRERGWRSFDAGLVADIAKTLHVINVSTSLTEPPSPVRHFIGRAAQVIASGSEEDIEIDGEPGNPAQSGMSPEEWFRLSPRGGDGVLDDVARQLHRARRFYERPEEQRPYRERPDPDARTEALPSPEPEFHARCAMAGDHPTLLRRLGLVIDLRVDDLDALRRSTYLLATVTVDGAEGMCRPQRVRCEALADGSFVTVSEHGDWLGGALALGDESRFTVIDIDADASALKAERWLGILPQLSAIARNGDPAAATSPALRAGGFTLARRHRALLTKRRIPRQLQIEAGEQLDLHTEDVLRGMRIEVWDDTVGRWRSLHERESTIEVGTQVLSSRDEGFVQGTAAAESSGVTDSKIHVHEALVGWEGWSLSVERPGKRIRFVHDDDPELQTATRREVVEDTPGTQILGERPPHPVRATHRVVPGSLPRLRFGRDYAFRAWAVDLAGNSRPHELDPSSVPNLGPVLPQVPHLGETVLEVQPSFTEDLRVLAHETLEAARLEVEAPDATPVRLDGEVVEILGSRLRQEPRVRSAPSVARRTLVDRLAAHVVSDPSQPLVVDTTVRGVDRLSELLASQAAGIGGLEVAPSLAEAATAALATVSGLKPFLRWDPVLPPAVVPLRRYTEGESVRVLVVRSGVTQDPDTLDIRVTDPASYAVAANAAVADLGYSDVASRHLAPPKTSQVMAELHGMLDQGIGSHDAAKVQQALTWSLVESGSFMDAQRWSLEDPTLQVDQPGRRLVLQSAASVERDEGTLQPGDPLGQGQYVVHDTPELTLPYLPDPLAVGVSLRFPDAERHGIPAPEGSEGFTAGYRGTWPAIEPFRLDLTGSDQLGASVDGREINVRLPAADLQRFRLSSSLRPEDLPLLGVWRSLSPTLTGDPDVREAARDGWIWGLTPADEVMLVHAVPRPLEAPRAVRVRAAREPGANAAHLAGVLDVHGASTDSVIAEASWTDPVDELDKPGPHERASRGIAFQTRVGTDEDLLVLAAADGTAESVYGPLRLHAAVHELGDTRHRRVTYTMRATTRFREYFHPTLLAPTHPGDDGRSVVSAPIVVDVPSSAPPAAPLVHSVIPLFRWDDGTEAEQPMAWRHDRRAGVRIYLERPWFSSGEGELLGLLLAPQGHDEFGPPPDDQSGFPYVCKIGADPIWRHRPVRSRALTPLHLDTLVHLAGHDDRPQPGRPTVVRRGVPVRTGGSSYAVDVAGYQPQFNTERGLWYVDAAIDPWADSGLRMMRDQVVVEQPQQGFWPFVRLAVARFQPSSVTGCHLSEPVRCDYVQLPPERHTSVSRTDERRVRVVVAGTRGWRDSHPGRGGPDRNRVVVARLQQWDPQVPTDLGWRTVDHRELMIRSDPSELEVAWMGELDAGKAFPLRRPAPPKGDGRWRVTVEEWERFLGDPLPQGDERWERRLVFADSVLL